MRISVFALFLMLFWIVPNAIAEPTPEEMVRLLGSDTDAHDQFGAAISVSGNRLVVGAPYDRGAESHHGSAYVFERHSAAREGWREVAKLKASHANLAELFGSSVAIDGETIAIGALINDDQAQSGEAVYIYQRDLEGLKSWNQIARLRPSDPESLTFFGASIALEGGILAVGAPEDGTGALSGGAVYLFEQRADGDWRQAAKLNAIEARPFDYFGFSVALSGDTLAVGAPNSDEEHPGSVYIFQRSPDGHWQAAARLQPTTEQVENFGWSVDLQEQTVVIGAPAFASDTLELGAAFIFERRDHGAWEKLAKLEPVQGVASKNFGNAVALQGDLVLIGDPDDSETARSAGAAHVFARHQGGNNSWGGLYKMRTNSGTEGDRFGQAVALDEGVLAVGSDLQDAAGTNSGLAHLFLRKEASATPKLWIPQQIPTTTGLRVEVPIFFESRGFDISATTFEIDYDEYCLDLESADDIIIHAPPGMGSSVHFDEGDTNGEIEIAFLDLSTPLTSLPDGELVTLVFTATCPAYTEASTIAPVSFSDTPSPSFGSASGQSVEGQWRDGSVEILGGDRGDCNRDHWVNAGDLPACTLEIFDGDGGFWADAPHGGFPGSPIGCDANADFWINAGDLSCKLLLIFGRAEACETREPEAERDPSEGPILSFGRVQGRFNRPIEIPIYFDPGKAHDINTLAFSIPLDPRLRFRDTDKDGDSIPDAIQFNVPRHNAVSVKYVADPTPRLDLVIIEPNSSFNRYLREPIMTLMVRIPRQEKGLRIPLGFGDTPFASYGSTTGRSVAGQTFEGELFVRP